MIVKNYVFIFVITSNVFVITSNIFVITSNIFVITSYMQIHLALFEKLALLWESAIPILHLILNRMLLQCNNLSKIFALFLERYYPLHYILGCSVSLCLSGEIYWRWIFIRVGFEPDRMLHKLYFLLSLIHSEPLAVIEKLDDVGMGWGAGWEKSWVEWDHMVSSQPYLTLTEFTIMQINIKFCTHSLYPLTGAIVNQAFHSIHWGSLALCYVDNHFKYRKSIF